MASTKVETVQVVDSRIDPLPKPTYAVTIGPDQNQWYKIPASAKSDSYIAFNNLTTLGKDRAYLDTFELEISVDIDFTCATTDQGTTGANNGGTNQTSTGHTPAETALRTRDTPPHTWFMPRSFPFNSCVDQAKININGGAFFSTPAQTIRAHERYWDQNLLNRSYADTTPCAKPLLQNEFGKGNPSYDDLKYGWFQKTRTRMFGAQSGYYSREGGPYASDNFSLLPDYTHTPSAPDGAATTGTITYTWREPVMCAPFSMKYDATYGRPLYNITSIDLTFNMINSLKNMFLCCAPLNVQSWSVSIKSIDICYQVMTVTAPLEHSMTIVPYRRFVPYITQAGGNPGAPTKTGVNGKSTDVKIKSGVYTLNEVPTAIWVFGAPTLSEYQTFISQGENGTLNTDVRWFNHEQSSMSNKLFGFLKHINISCGNTTQILDTASVYDLYRIAKANGCKDSFEDWTRSEPFRRYSEQNNAALAMQTIQSSITGKASTTDVDFTFKLNGTGATQTYNALNFNTVTEQSPGAGSVLRLIPGTDIVLPEQRLVPGANANSLVIQVEATFDFNFAEHREVPMALWLVFEYVGVATITPGNCVVTMNPLGNGRVMEAAPIVSATQVEPLSTTDGAGWLDTIKRLFQRGKELYDKGKRIYQEGDKIAKDTKFLSRASKLIPKYGDQMSKFFEEHGYGYDDVMTALPPSKHPRLGDVDGGAVMGLGDFC